MADNVLETRILLRYDTYSNWMNSNTILLPGEVAIASMTNARTIELSNSTPANTPPAIGLKIGDGYHYFRELPWVQAVAADVYNWAKQATKPTYSASEIVNLQQFVEQYSTSTGGDGTVTPRLYQIIEGTGDDAHKYFLQYKTSEEEGWITDTTHSIDLTSIQAIINWIGNDINRYNSLGNRTAEHIQYEISKLDYNDIPVNGQVVIAVSETDGKISVTRTILNLNDLSGTLDITHGGTGIDSLPNGQILVGHGTNAITGIEIANVIAEDTKIAPNYVVKAYIDEKTAGLTGAMHYIGEASVVIDLNINNAIDPRIQGYDFSKALPGDVITLNQQEFVWTGNFWRLLGDEGSYAVKGSIVDADVSIDAAIQQNKILNLTNDLYSKVDKVAGKQLSTNDYTNEEKSKLESIEANAQRNIIEHIFVNDIERIPTIVENKPNSINLEIAVFDDLHKEKLDRIEDNAQVNAIEHIFLNNDELPITTIDGNTKSVNLNILQYTQDEKTKLQSIETSAQVNKIERIFINNVEYSPDANTKEIHLTLDQAALNLNVLEGARIPGTTAGTYEEVAVTQGIKKLELARIAKTGNVKDLLQNNDEYITLYCGTSTEVI